MVCSRGRMGKAGAVGTDPFDQLMTSSDPALVVVTTAAGDERAGCLVGFHAQSSMDPHGYGVWISKANHTFGVAIRASHLAVHFLTADDHELARTFGAQTGDEVDKFEQVPWRRGPQGVPVLTGCDHGLVGRKEAVLDDGGDHVVFTLDPVEVWSREPFTPLRTSDVEDLAPAHDAGDHPDHPR